MLALGLTLWAAVPVPAWWALLSSYALALLLVSWLLASGASFALAGQARVAFGLVALLPGGLALARAGGELLHAEGIGGLPALTAERIQLERLPSIAPPLVSGDRPQTFFVHAAPHAHVRVGFGKSVRALDALELGEGLYQVRYDPRQHGVLTPADGALPVVLSVDDRETTRTLLAATPLAHPRWLRTSPAAALAAAVSEETDELAIVSARGLERRVPVGDGPADCVFLDEARVVISHRYEPALWVIDVVRGVPTQRVALGHGQGRLALSPSGQLLAVASEGPRPEVVIVDLMRAQVRERIPLSVAPDWLAFAADDATLIATTRADARIWRYRSGAGGFRAAGDLALGRAAVTLTRAPDGLQMFAAVTDYRPQGPSNLGNHFVQDQILTIEVEPLRVVDALLTARRSSRQARAGDIDRGVSPLAISAARAGGLWLAFGGSDELWRVQGGQPEPAIMDLVDTDLHAPHGIAELADGTLVTSSPGEGAIGLLSPSATEWRILRLAPDAAYLRAHRPESLARRLGERVFYEGTRSGVSCQSCHMHADSDESAHNLGTHRLLPTLSVRGLAGTGPYLRDGSFATLGDLDHVAQTLYRGYLRKARGRPDTLAAYLAALPRRDRPLSMRPQDRARERRGVRAFVRAGCSSCHSFPALTHLGQHLARALFPTSDEPEGTLFDTPSLLSLGVSAPYLSDGRARTLDAVFGTHNRANRHGDSARLSAAELRDLYGFLESL